MPDGRLRLDYQGTQEEGGVSRREEPGLILSPWQVMQIIGHARAARPREACGILGGRGASVQRIYPLPNTEESSHRYLAEPQAQVDAMLAMEERGSQIVGIYHSHLRAPAYPSPTDVDMAAYPSAVYVIVSLSNEGDPILGGFRIQDGEVEEVTIAIEDRQRVDG